MPYIKQAHRDLVDPAIDKLAAELDRFEKPDGVLNYVITKLILSVMHLGNYGDYERVIGLIECIKMEIHRRAVAPYEDSKMKENGDV